MFMHMCTLFSALVYMYIKMVATCAVCGHYYHHESDTMTIMCVCVTLSECTCWDNSFTGIQSRSPNLVL